MSEWRRSPRTYPALLFDIVMVVVLATVLYLAIRWMVVTIPEPYRDPAPPTTTR